MSRRLLMVDDERDLLWLTGRQIERDRPDLAFTGVSSPLEALESLRSAPPDVLVTDLRMPGMTGLELILEARRISPHLPVVLVTAYGDPEVLENLRGRSAVEYLEKPFSFHALSEAIDRALAASDGFSGAISLPMLPDLLQIFTLSQTNGALHVSRAGASGTIWFDRGAIVHAVVGELVGEVAVHQLLRWRGGKFSLDPAAAPPTRSIFASWQEVLLEGCRLLDEEDREPEAAAAPLAALEAPPAGDAGAFSAGTEPAPGPAGTPAAVDLVLDLDSAELRVTRGTPDLPASVGRELLALIDAAERMTGASPRGTLEWLGADVGLFVAWNRPGKSAQATIESLSGRTAAAKFRFNASRRAASGADGSDPRINEKGDRDGKDR